MKKSVRLSTYCLVISAISSLILICALFYAMNKPDNKWAVGSLGVLIVLLFLSTLFYMPLSISVNDKSLNILRPLKIKSIPLSEIADVKLCKPTMAAKRLCGSGGWFGWYGYFSEPDLGKYFAYYGKASDCFLVTLNNNKKYMLSCTDAPAVVEIIRERIEK